MNRRELEPRLENPTLVMVTDRQDLDGQLFGVFAGAGDLLGETPKQANSRAELREHLMNRPSGGIIFTTIQKFGLEAGEDRFPVLTDRHNIVVIADEAHRTQYGFKAKIDSESGAIKVSRRWKEIQEGSTFTKNAWGYYEGERLPVTWSFSNGEFLIDGPGASQCVLDALVAELHVEEPD